MRLVLQRVKSANVTLPPSTTPISSIGNGVVALVGLHANDTLADLKYCTKKLVASKLWPDENDKPWRLSVNRMKYEVLLVSQFTLYGSVSNKKHQPDYKASMKNDEALEMYNVFKEMVLTELGGESERKRLKDGEFGSMMDLSLVNSGPVTLIIDSPIKEVLAVVEGIEKGEKVVIGVKEVAIINEAIPPPPSSVEELTLHDSEST